MSEVELISGSPKYGRDGRDHRNGHSMRARLTIQLSALLGDQAAGRCTVNTTSRPAGPIYLITAIDQAVQARTSFSQNFEGMLKPAVRRPGRDGPPRPREERRRGAAARRGVLECVLQTSVVLGAELTWMRTRTLSNWAIPGTTYRALPPRDDDWFGRAHQLEDGLRSPGASFG